MRNIQNEINYLILTCKWTKIHTIKGHHGHNISIQRDLWNGDHLSAASVAKAKKFFYQPCPRPRPCRIEESKFPKFWATISSQIKAKVKTVMLMICHQKPCWNGQPLVHFQLLLQVVKTSFQGEIVRYWHPEQNYISSRHFD